jgi:hypothetical protein
LISSLFTALIMFNNVATFQKLGLQVSDDTSSVKPMMEWTEEIILKEYNLGFSTFEKYMSTMYSLIHQVQPPRMFDEMKKILQLTKETST